MATTDSSPARIAVEVVYALPERQTLLALHVPVGTTAQEAVDIPQKSVVKKRR
jgi:putative ubiquitin-RnfH superfamily antitoxin RatB of RatAB toxin-antitoxin module